MNLNLNSAFEQLNSTEKQRISVTVNVVISFLDEPISSENLNGHATSSVTSEEVTVDIESTETQLEEQASTEDKTGNIWISYCVQHEFLLYCDL